MKKITLLAILALGVSFTSCKKDRTCTCTTTITETTVGGPLAGTVNQSQASTTTLKDVNGKSARANCISWKSTQPSYPDGAGGTVTDSYVQSCSLD